MFTVSQSAATRPPDERPHSRAASPPPPHKILPDGVTVVVEGSIRRQITVDVFEVTWQWGSLRREVLARLDRKLRERGARGHVGQKVRLVGRLFESPWTIVFLIPSRESASCP